MSTIGVFPRLLHRFKSVSASSLFFLSAIVLGGGLAFYFSYAIRFDFDIPERYYRQFLYFLPFVLCIKAVVFLILENCTASRHRHRFHELLFSMIYAAICSSIFLVHYVFNFALPIPRGIIVLDCLLTAIGVGCVLIAGQLIMERFDLPGFSATGNEIRKGIIIGAPDTAETLVRQIKRNGEWGITVRAVFDYTGLNERQFISGIKIRSLDEIDSYLKANSIDTVILAIAAPDPDRMEKINTVLAGKNVNVIRFPALFELMGEKSTPSADEYLDAETLLGSRLEPNTITDESSTFIPVIRPTLPEIHELFNEVKKSYRAGQVTSGDISRNFEKEIRSFCKVEHAISVSSCTSGLMLVFAAMEFPRDAQVIVPSFTFAATVQALLWTNLTPVYVDCRIDTMTIDTDEVKKAINRKTAAIYPVNIFGVPPDIEPLEQISREHGIPVIYDSAQGLGSTYHGKPAGGFGMCEVFSLSPAKVITAMEGGVITTNDSYLAGKLRSMRDYGKGPDGEEMVMKGLSSRMIEFDAAVGLLNLRNADSLIQARLNLIQRYRERLEKIPGCYVQEIPSDRTTSGSHPAFRLGENAAMDRDGLMEALKARKIQTKRYFHPPVHLQGAFTKVPNLVIGELPNTMMCSKSVLVLPLYSHMAEDKQIQVIEAVESLLGG